MTHNRRTPKPNDIPVPVARLAACHAIHRHNPHPVVASSNARVAHEAVLAAEDAQKPATASYSSKNVTASNRAREHRRDYVKRKVAAVETALERFRRLGMMYRALKRADAIVEGGGGGRYGQQKSPAAADAWLPAVASYGWEILAATIRSSNFGGGMFKGY
jgi:hypothetical protein